MGHVQNGRLYIHVRYRNNSKITITEWFKALTDRNPSLFYCKNYFLSVLKVEKLKHKKSNFVHLLSFLLSLFSITHNLENYRVYMNILHTTRWLLYYWRCSFSDLEPCVSYNWWGMALNTHHDHFRIHHFVHTFIHKSNTIGCMWMLYILNNCFTTIDVHFLIYRYM